MHLNTERCVKSMLTSSATGDSLSWFIQREVSLQWWCSRQKLRALLEGLLAAISQICEGLGRRGICDAKCHFRKSFGTRTAKLDFRSMIQYRTMVRIRSIGSSVGRHHRVITASCTVILSTIHWCRHAYMRYQFSPTFCSNNLFLITISSHDYLFSWYRASTRSNLRILKQVFLWWDALCKITIHIWSLDAFTLDMYHNLCVVRMAAWNLECIEPTICMCMQPHRRGGSLNVRTLIHDIRAIRWRWPSVSRLSASSWWLSDFCLRESIP